jgi:uncharacterized protein YkwD
MRRLVIILLSVLTIATCDDSDSLFGPPSDIADNIFDHVNHYRLMSGVEVLEKHSDLNQLASDHASFMAQNGNVSHDNEYVRYSYVINELSMYKYAELVEGGELYGRDLIEKWSENESSALVIIGDYKYIGIGISDAGNKTYATIIFTK